MGTPVLQKFPCHEKLQIKTTGPMEKVALKAFSFVV
jgi:hypothetical protein